MSEHHRKRSLCYAKYSGYVIEDSSENQRDFFYVIFVANPDFEHHPKDGVEGQRGKAPKPKFIPCFLTLLQFVFLLESWPKKILLLPDFLWSAALRCHILFCSVIHPGVRVVICHLAYFDLKIRVKTWDSSVFLSCYALICCVIMGFYPCARVVQLIFLFICKDRSKSSVLVGLSPAPTSTLGARKGLVPHCLLGSAVVPELLIWGLGFWIVMKM